LVEGKREMKVINFSTDFIPNQVSYQSGIQNSFIAPIFSSLGRAIRNIVLSLFIPIILLQPRQDKNVQR
jgi:hypothetical protein